MVQGVEIKNGFIQNVNPATGELITPLVPVSTPDQIAEAITIANRTQQTTWSALPLPKRIELLREGVANIEGIREELIATITKEMGKVTAESTDEVDAAIGLKGKWLDMVQEANEDERLGDGTSESVIVRDPLGVVVVISPWNVRQKILLL